jgi:hypothetical protein
VIEMTPEVRVTPIGSCAVLPSVSEIVNEQLPEFCGVTVKVAPLELIVAMPLQLVPLAVNVPE